MRLPTAMIAGFSMMGAVVLPAQASAETRIFPYASSANYCPAGLQPITISGVICCGTPNQTMSYQQAKVHPVKKVRHAVPKRANYDCAIGEKGCR